MSSLRRQLDLQSVAIGLIHLPLDDGYTFTTLMPNSEEVYIVIEGRGLMLLNGELIEKPVEGSRTYASQLAILYS